MFSFPYKHCPFFLWTKCILNSATTLKILHCFVSSNMIIVKYVEQTLKLDIVIAKSVEHLKNQRKCNFHCEIKLWILAHL